MRRLPVLLFVAAVACAPPARYREVRPGLSCDRANKVTYRTMVQLGYAVTEVVPASATRAGVVRGTKRLPDGRTTGAHVVVACDAHGAVLQPVEDALMPNYEFSRAFGYSFKTLVQRPDVEQPKAKVGLQVLVVAIPPQQAVLDLGGAATVGGAVPVRVTVRNNTDRAVDVDPWRIELVGDDDGTGTTALDGPALASALAPGAGGARVRAEPLTAGTVPPGRTVSGFLVFPPGDYREARITIEDVETGEGEGFVAPVQ
jgi:hypothetical protein